MVSRLFSSIFRPSRPILLAHCTRRRITTVWCSTWTQGEMTSLHDALKKHKSMIGLYPPSFTSSTVPQPKVKTMVLLVGWAESTIKVLSKYASIYTDNFNIPCLAIAPPIQLMWFTSRGNSITNSVIKSLNESLESDSPVSLILHLCSAGGQVVLPQLVQEMRVNPHSLVQQRCVIFDSGPAKFSLETGTSAAGLLYKQGGINLLSYGLLVGAGQTVNVVIGNRKRLELKEAMESQFMAVPQLYLYSKKDSVAPYQWVEGVMEGQRERGREIRSHCWEDSEHVQHFREHTQEYIEQIRRFFNEFNITSS